MHTHMGMHVVAAIPMRAQAIMIMKNMVILMRTATHAVVDMTMSMKDIPTPMATHVAVAMNIPMSTHMHMLIPTDTTFLVTLLTVSAKSAIRMRNTATFAAKA